MKYATPTDVATYMGLTLDSGLSSRLNTIIEDVSRLMDRLCDRKLVAEVIGSGDDEYEDKYYDGNGKSKIYIDDCLEVHELMIGDQYGDNLVANTSFLLGARGRSSRELALKGGSFTNGTQNVKVTGRFGYFDTLPRDVTFACVVIVSGIMRAEDPTNRGKRSESIGNYSVTYDDNKGFTDFMTAKNILDSYRYLAI
jgi:hypothetical protein